MGWWGAGVKEDNEGPQLGPFRVGSLAILLFDVLSEILTSCEAVCFFFLPKPGFGCGSGNQVGGGILRAMKHRKPYTTQHIGDLCEVGVGGHGASGVARGVS